MLTNPSSYFLPQQASKLGDELLGKGIAALEKSAEQEDGGIVSQKIILPKLEIRLLSH